MPTRRQLIQKITLNSTGGNIIFSNIPQNYTDLKIVVSARYALPGVPSIRMRFNSDSGNNYTNRILEGNGSTAISTAESSTNNIFIGNVPGSATTSNTFCNIESYIPNYSSSNNKSVLSKSVTENNATTAYIDSAAGLWSNASSINSINIYLTDLAANSTFYLYGITHVPIIRGGEVSIANGYKIHTFRSSGSLQVIEGGQVEYLVVAGGGGGGGPSGGGSWGSGGGGAGGYLASVGAELSGGGTYLPRVNITTGVYSAIVGSGGAGGSAFNVKGSSGTNSSAPGLTAIGGGGGGSYNNASINESAGVIGGSGGGAGMGFTSNASGGSGTTGQGYSGGSTTSGQSGGTGAGGGGASGVGGNNTLYPTFTGGSAGPGISSSITGYSITRAYGGRGGRGWNTSVNGPELGVGDSAASNSGGGGEGARSSSSPSGGNGGSGIVIIRYPYDGN